MDPVPPELAAQLEALAAEAKGDTARKLEYLLDALIMRGQLPASFKVVVAKIRADPNQRKVRLSVITDKYEVDSPDVPCAELIPLCGARCCGFVVLLSEQDVLERKLPFRIDDPYLLPRDPETKRCTCMAADGACTVYDARPGTCRTYDCREDPRVWIDYEKRIPAP